MYFSNKYWYSICVLCIIIYVCRQVELYGETLKTSNISSIIPRFHLMKYLSVILISFLITIVRSYYLPIIPRNVPTAPQCTYFTGAGIYFFWQLGCAQYMKENCVLKDMPTIAGASAGSLTAALLISDSDLKAATNKALELAESNKIYERKSGLAGIWGGLLKEWLEAVIPDEVTETTFKNLEIAVTPPLKSPKLVTGFKSKTDVIEACLASCHVPLFLDGRAYTEYRGEPVVDGSFWYFITKNRETGLPLPVQTPVDSIFWVDYGDDEQFMNSISGNFLGLLTPNEVIDVVDAGYNFMKREHYLGRLPMATYKKPSFVRQYVTTISNVATTKIPNLVTNKLDDVTNYASSSWKWLTTGAGVTGVTAATMTTSTAASKLDFDSLATYTDIFQNILGTH